MGMVVIIVMITLIIGIMTVSDSTLYLPLYKVEQNGRAATCEPTLLE